MTSGEEATRRRGARPKRLTMSVGPEAAKTAAPFDADAWLAQYTPTPYDGRTLQIDAFVRSALQAYFAVTQVNGITAARRLARSLTLLGVHVAASGGTLSTKQALDPRTINQFHEAELKRLRTAAKALPIADRTRAETRAETTMATFRSCLRRIGEVTNPKAPWEFAPVRAHRHVKVPYCPAEIAQLEAQIPRMTPEHARCAEGLFVLGLGAGLDGRWAAKVTTDDVTPLPGGGHLVTVAGRVVPVLAAYDTRLRALLAQCAPGEFLIGGSARHADAAHEAANRLRLDPKGPKLELARLRSTWLVNHLTVGTRLPELMEAAGLETLTVLGDLVEFVPEPDADRETAVATARQIVRGPLPTGTPS